MGLFEALTGIPLFGGRQTETEAERRQAAQREWAQECRESKEWAAKNCRAPVTKSMLPPSVIAKEVVHELLQGQILPPAFAVARWTHPGPALSMDLDAYCDQYIQAAQWSSIREAEFQAAKNRIGVLQNGVHAYYQGEEAVVFSEHSVAEDATVITVYVKRAPGAATYAEPVMLRWLEAVA